MYVQYMYTASDHRIGFPSLVRRLVPKFMICNPRPLRNTIAGLLKCCPKIMIFFSSQISIFLILEKGKKKLYMGRIFISLSQTGRQKVSYNFWAKFDYSDHICIAQHIAAVGNNLKSRFCFDGEGI